MTPLIYIVPAQIRQGASGFRAKYRYKAARELLALLIKRSVEREGNAPTAMMLRVVLEKCGHEIEYVSLSELGLNVGS